MALVACLLIVSMVYCYQYCVVVKGKYVKMADDGIVDDNHIDKQQGTTIYLKLLNDDIDDYLEAEAQKRLYEIYKESPSQCLKECEHIGYSDKIIDKIMNKFERQIS